MNIQNEVYYECHDIQVFNLMFILARNDKNMENEKCVRSVTSVSLSDKI